MLRIIRIQLQYRQIGSNYAGQTRLLDSDSLLLPACGLSFSDGHERLCAERLSKIRMEQTLELDPAIRNWVILPLTAVIMLVGVCRHYVSLLIKSEEKAEIATISQMQTLQRAQRLRGASHFLRPSAFAQRKVYFTKKGGALKSSGLPAAQNPMMNPGGMMNMMKNNMLFMIPNVGMMAWISYFFPGFVALKVPFPLTPKFKMMVQRGVDLAMLDSSYVTSLAWYFVAMFGLQGFYKLVLGAAVDDEARLMQAQMGQMGGPGMGFNAKAAFKQEKDSVALLKHKWAVEEVEKVVLGSRYPID